MPPTVSLPSQSIVTEVWYDYSAFATEQAVTVDVATQALLEATFILSALTKGQIHGARCWLDTYLAPHGSLLNVAHGPLADVESVHRSHVCGTDPEEIEFCVYSDKAIDVGCAGSPSLAQRWPGIPEMSDWRLYASCACRPLQLEVRYTQKSTLIPGSDRASKKLAEEYLKAAQGKACKLPERITSVTRQGISWTILDPQDFLENGLTGISAIDGWLSAVKIETNGFRVTDPLRGVLLKSQPLDCVTGDPIEDGTEEDDDLDGGAPDTEFEDDYDGGAP